MQENKNQECRFCGDPLTEDIIKVEMTARIGTRYKEWCLCESCWIEFAELCGMPEELL